MIAGVASGSQVYSGKVEAQSNRVGPEGWASGGRITFACLSLAEAVSLVALGGQL